MDPVTAFSLAAGVLQVVDLSFKALSKCREIYKDGSLAQHRTAAELTTYLAETTERLERTVQTTSNPISEEAKEVLEVSRECSATAKGLLTELRKLQMDPGASVIQAIKRSTRAVRRRTMIAETEKKLEKYQQILDTRILSKLNSHSVQQIERFETLDQSVKDLALALSQGNNTVAQLLTNQAVTLRGHIDDRFDDQAHQEAIRRVQQQFRDSLFFPEIFARQDDIVKAHKGTCRWVFSSSQDTSLGNSSLDDDSMSDSSTSEGSPRSAPSRTWYEFTSWLQNNEDIYWLSGKPGSGKSTLMKYIASEFRAFYRSKTALTGWDTGSDLVTCSFFFWANGGPLQKNLAGLVRSLLYQIAEQREDLIPIMLGQEEILPKRTSSSHDPARLYAWTKERLFDALKRCLDRKPSALRVCLFIDGLDEFCGDEDLLLDKLRDLSGSPQTHVCVSSRPEQIFRQGFAHSPQLRLQDLNYRDIERAVKGRLLTILREKFPQMPERVDDLIEDVALKSEGIFLWAELMSKDLRRGARNSDSILELSERLALLPNTIEGLYEHVFKRLEKPYFQDATKYLQILFAEQEYRDLSAESEERYGRSTLLHFAYADANV